MAIELFFGSLAVLTFSAIIIVLMTTNKRVGYSGKRDRQDQQDKDQNQMMPNRR